LNATEFNQIAEARIAHCRSTLIAKGEEYSRDGDRLHNFKTAAAIDNETPEQALWGMCKKHVVSVRDMIKDIERGIVPSQKMLDEKITDWINYGLLLEGLFGERRTGSVDPVVFGSQFKVSMDDDFPGMETRPPVGVMSEEIRRQVEDLGFKVAMKRPLVDPDA